MDEICRFNENPTTKLLQKLLAIRDSGMVLLVPDKYQKRVYKDTPRPEHYRITKVLIRKPVLPNTGSLEKEIKELASKIYTPVPSDNGGKIVIDTSFWVLALMIGRGSSCLYSWESLFYRDVFDDYLTSLFSLFLKHSLILKDFETALDFIPSLFYLTTPIRFYAGGGEIYASESLLMDYIRTTHSPLFEKMFKEPEDAYEVVNQINPSMISDEFSAFVKIDTVEEIKLVHKPDNPVDSTYDEDYHITWWYPGPIADHMAEIIRDSKLGSDDTSDYGDE